MRYARFVIVLAFTGLGACLGTLEAQAQEDDSTAYNFDTEGKTVCGENENLSPVPEHDPPDIVSALRDFKRGTLITCVDSVDDAFGNRGFSATYDKQKAAFFPIVNVAAGIHFHPDDSLSFSAWRLAGGPTEGRVSCNVGSDTTLRELGTFPMTETPTRHSVSLYPIQERFGTVMDSIRIFFQARFSDSTTVDSSGAFYLDEVDGEGAIDLPVELTRFTATMVEDPHSSRPGALLRWRTASETNNAAFRVEHRPPQAAAWAHVGSVEGAGTTSRPQRYRFRVPNLSPGKHAFRLRQVDLDGSETVHGPVYLEVGLSERLVLRPPSPNPAGRRATVQFAVRDGGSAQLALYDALGRRVRTAYEGTLPAGQVQTVRLPTTNLPSGRYFLRLTGPDGATRLRSLSVVR